jgi:hypothetical protein
MVASRPITPGLKLVTVPVFDPATATSSLGEALGLRAVSSVGSSLG